MAADKEVVVGTNVIFTDTSNDVSATGYEWNFGGSEGTSTLQNDTHRYNNVGLYTVTHSVTNTCGKTDCTPKTISVVTELSQPSGGSSVVVMLAAAAIGLMMMAKK